MVHNEDSTSRSSNADEALERLFDLAVVLGDLITQGLSADGLTPARAEVIWLLNRSGPLTQRELSQTLRCTPRNVTGLVDALQTAEFVTRKPHPTDRRATLVTLTQQGETLATTWHAQHHHGASDLFAGVSAVDLATFNTLLDHLLRQLRENPPRA